MSWNRIDPPSLRFAAAFCAALGFCGAVQHFVEPTPALAAAAAKPSARIDVERRRDAARLDLQWRTPVRVQSNRIGRELTLRFDRQLGDAAFDKIPQRLEGWVENVQYGYDSVLLTLPVGVSARVIPQPRGARVEFAAEKDATPKSDAAVRGRLQQLKASALMETGDALTARDMAAELVAASPNDASALVLLGNAEERLGRWRAANGYYRRALDITPDNADLKRAHARLTLDHADQFRVESEFNHVHHADTQKIARVLGRNELGLDLSFAYAFETRHVSIAQLRRRTGAVRPFKGQRTKGNLTLTYDWPLYHTTSVTSFLSERVAGIGLSHVMKTEDRETRVGVAWREPLFTIVEGLAGGGRRDRIAVAHIERFAPGWAASIGGGYNRYGLGGFGDLARSASAEASLRYSLDLGNPKLTFGYVMDAEYVSRHKWRDDGNGNLYQPLPLSTREVHALQAELDGTLLEDDLRYALIGGYAFDRRNSNGPFASASFGYQPIDILELGLQGSYSRSSSTGNVSGAVASGGGAYLMMRY